MFSESMESVLKKYGCIKIWDINQKPPEGGAVWIYEKTNPLDKYEDVIL